MENFVHPPDLAKRVGIERSKAHVGEGAPEVQIAATVSELGSPLVVIGSMARKGMSEMVVGNTAERILDQINADIMVVVQR
jgi:nucleotide-binding universal stress UspA family protein